MKINKKAVLFVLSLLFLCLYFVVLKGQTIAETPGNLKNVYCRMTRGELNASVWRICNGNPGENGWLGQDDIDDNNPNDGTNNRTNIAIGSNVVLQYLSGPNGAVINTNRTPRDTRCSVVQHDGLDSNDDVWVQYSADTSNYCVIHYTPSRQNYCVQNGVRVNVQSSQQEPDYPGSTLNTWIKGQFDQKCVASPTSTPIPNKPTANMNTVCTAPQNFGNLSYDMKLTEIDLKGKPFEKAQFQLCMTPSTNVNHQYIYTHLFNSQADYKGGGTASSPAWACNKIGPDVTYLNSNNNFMTVKFDSSRAIRGTHTINSMANWIYQRAALGDIDANTKFTLKTVLTAGGQTNDNIVSKFNNNPGGIKINPYVCTSPTNMPTPTKTPTPTISPTTPPACTWTTYTEWTDQHRGHDNSNINNYTDNNTPITLVTVNLTKQQDLKVRFQQKQINDNQLGNCGPQFNEEAYVSLNKMNGSVVGEVKASHLFLDGNYDLNGDQWLTKEMTVNLGAGTYALRSVWAGDGRTNAVFNQATNRKYTDPETGKVYDYPQILTGSSLYTNKNCRWNGSYQIRVQYCK